uniref:Probable DNA ligase n=1 Tax=candidate division WWE3 bacterium TaxID=2053526 RepID=A0A7C4TQH0_UNCKA
MRVSRLADYLNKLEQTSKRLEITEILKNMIIELEQHEVDEAVYLSLGYLAAQFSPLQFNLAEKTMAKVLAKSFTTSETEVAKIYSKTGDLGNVALEINPNQKDSKTSVEELHSKLVGLANISGSGSQEKKINVASTILSSENKLSSKFITRIILGTVRLGFTELTVIDALAKFITDDNKKSKDIKEKIEAKYRIHPDIGLIAKNIKRSGIKGLDNIEMEVGIPVHAQKTQRLEDTAEIIEKMHNVWVEYKFDGTRVQLHLDRNRAVSEKSIDQQSLFEDPSGLPFVKTFTRNLEETTDQFPDLVEAAAKQIQAESVILDGEAIGFNKETGEYLPFQETMQRKRKHGIKEALDKIPLKYLIFDLLYLDGKSLVGLPLTERRQLLERIVKPGSTIEIANHLETSDEEELSNFSKLALEKGLEGIVAKKPDSPYEAGARNFTWVKLKKSKEQILSDTVECVVLGYYFGRGVRANFGIGGFLVGVWDEKTLKYKTLTKVGTGLKDEDWKELKKKADKLKIKQRPSNADISTKFDCDVWTEPSLVVELAADEISKSSEHSAGYALRFPRLVKFRDDKGAKDTTSIEEIEAIYKIQKSRM